MAQNLSKEAQELLDLLEKKQKMAAMLAPSFVVDFQYPEIVGRLRRLGFEIVAEVSRGAIDTNKQLNALLKLHPDRKVITSPCPTIVRLIRNKYPHLEQYLAKIDSPMTATAKILRKDYPDYKIVHFSPCMVKKLEANEDFPELEILALTYKDLAAVFNAKKNVALKKDLKAKFDIVGEETRLYPISGGLAQSSGITQNFTDEEYDVISGPVLADRVLKEFPHKPELKILDILNCDGGCIAGPGMISVDGLSRRRQKVIDFWKSLQK